MTRPYTMVSASNGPGLGSWNVAKHDWVGSFINGTMLPPGHCAISMFRSPLVGNIHGLKYRYGDHNGKVFTSRDAADMFMIERGYLQRYYRVNYAMYRHTIRKHLKTLQHYMIREIMKATDSSQIVFLSDYSAARIRRLTGDVLAGNHWAVGYHTAARRLRPDLYKDDI